MFEARCKAQGVPPYLQFLDLVANTDWLVCNDPALAVTTFKSLGKRYPNVIYH
jgi:hypothetical protein